jgi:hypothetical protein
MAGRPVAMTLTEGDHSTIGTKRTAAATAKENAEVDLASAAAAVTTAIAALQVTLIRHSSGYEDQKAKTPSALQDEIDRITAAAADLSTAAAALVNTAVHHTAIGTNLDDALTGLGSAANNLEDVGEYIDSL